MGQKFRLWVLRGYRIRIFTPETENHRAPRPRWGLSSPIFIDEKLVIFLFCPGVGQKFRLWVLRGYRIRIFTPEAENHRAPRPRWGLSSPIFIDEKLVIFLFCPGVGQKFRLWVLRGYRIRIFTPEAENHRAPCPRWGLSSPIFIDEKLVIFLFAPEWGKNSGCGY